MSGANLMPMLLVLAAGGVPLLDVDFTTFSVGFQDSTAFQANTFTAPVKASLALHRFYSAASSGYEGSRGETVQTSPTTIIRSALSQQIDIACIGNRTSSLSKRGLVIQHNVGQYVSTNTGNDERVRNLTLSGWTAGTGTTTGGYADSPDQTVTGCTDCNNAIGQFAPYIAWTSDRTAAYCMSSWQKYISGTTRQTIHPSSGIPTLTFPGATSGVWEKMAVTNGVTPDRYWDVADGGGPWPAMHVLVDYVQIEPGTFANESIPTARSARRGDCLDYATGSALIAANGQFKFAADFTPKFVSTDPVMFHANPPANDGDVALGWYLFSWGSVGTTPANYAYIKDADHKVYVKLAGGTEYVSTNAIAWSQYDQVQLKIEVGNGVASVLKYRLNSSLPVTSDADPWTSLVLSTVPDVPAPGSSTIAFFRNSVKDVTSSTTGSGATSDTGQLPCWLHRLRIGN